VKKQIPDIGGHDRMTLLKTLIKSEAAIEDITDYKCLIGSVLMEQYTYEDFKIGGLSLLTESEFTEKIYEAKDENEVVCALQEEYEKERKQRDGSRFLMSKKIHSLMKISIIVLSILLTLSIVWIAYSFFYIHNFERSMNELSDAYLIADYVKCIDCTKEISIDRMNLNQKYMLSKAYVLTDNLTNEQKDLIVSTLSYRENNGRTDYWIYIGRNDYAMAEDMAMRLSDDEILLYAYMKEKAYVEADISISGEAKETKIKELETKMSPYIKKYQEYKDAEEESRIELNIE
jgi:type VII secretion protein EssB